MNVAYPMGIMTMKSQQQLYPLTTMEGTLWGTEIVFFF